MADQQQAMQRCAHARQYLKSAKAMKGSKALVLKAVDLYEQVLQEHGQELSEPYFSLAYIAFAGARPDLSVRFLQAGLTLEPNNQRMRSFLLRSQKSAEKQAHNQALAEQKEAAIQATENDDSSPVHQLVSELGPEQIPDKVSRGSEVEMLQQVLQKLGHSVLISRVYDRPTYAAVRAVQSLHKLPVTGMVDAATREHLNPIVQVVITEQATHEQLIEIIMAFAEVMNIELSLFLKQMAVELLDLLLNLLQDFPDNEEEAMTTEDSPFPPREALVSRLGNMGHMGIVSKGEEVRRVQQVLLQLGYPVKVNGQFDLVTFSELSRFQLDHKLSISGIVEGPTRSHLNKLLQPIFYEEAAKEKLMQEIRSFQKTLMLKQWPTIEMRCNTLLKMLLGLIKSGRMPKIPAELANYFQIQSDLGPANRPAKTSQGREVRLLQQALSKMGYKVEVNGNYDNNTYAAVRSFQISKKLPMTGMVEAKTRSELNEMLLHVLGRDQPTQEPG